VIEAKRLWDSGAGVVFLDTRSPTAWEGSEIQIPGSIRVTVAELEQRLNEIPRGRPVITYCT
jgi:rhodanese-related sulfurtransferase